MVSKANTASRNGPWRRKKNHRWKKTPLGQKPVAESDSDFYFLFLDILVEHLRRNFSAW
jgi:hypothetical protein